MQPNGPQNLWQPQNEPGGEPQPTPSSPAPQPEELQGANNKSDTKAPMNITPHKAAFAQPRKSEDDEEAEDQPVLTWEASEYINHEKDFLWYFGFGIVVLVFLAVALFVKAWTFAVLVLIMAAATIVYIRRPPRTMRYSLSERGFHIGSQFHPYSEYRAFGVVDDGPFFAIMLVSIKRFMPSTLIYFAEQDGEKIVDMFASHLPMEDLELDFTDILIRRLRL
ncbi:hypothetical protein TM7_0548 [candidate division TM7 genomosp. GTL1]|nr:hypothetical protein TM7_0548 [candidate division TM7 genomosp. GTL1]